MAIGWTSQVELNINDGTYSFEITPSDFSWIGSVVPLGAAFSSIPCGLSVDWIGRKKTLLLISIPFVVGWIYIVWPAAVEMLIVGRFITGFCGIELAYILETPHFLISRGRLDDARKSLQWFRASDYNPEKDLDELKLAVEKSIQNKISFLDMFRDDLQDPFHGSWELNYLLQKYEVLLVELERL
ncbi:hypothetical protein B566_EDAN006961 [Ephemera danica]|nr:hypothetical protein B566_EDAN006961 [Ephemera danica]